MSLRWWQSFQGRALSAVAGVAVLLWLGLTLMTVWEVERDQSAELDAQLKLNAELVITAFPKSLADQGLSANFELPDGLKTEEFNYQIWTRDRRLVSRMPTTPLQPLNPSFEPGFHSLTLQGQRWRSYSVSDATGAVQVQLGEHQAQRRALVRLGALSFLVQLAVFLAVTALVLVGVQLWSARPLKRLRLQVEARAETDATAMSMQGLPAEVLPLVQAFNSLLARAENARQAQQRFVADAAHELRTPLAALQLQAQLALRALRDGSVPAQREALQRLQRGIARSTRVAEQLLELARMDSLPPPFTPESVSLPALGEALSEACAPLAARRRVALRVQLPDVTLSSQAALLHTALRNLLDNALRYSPAGSQVLLGAELSADGWALFVQDAGPGLSTPEREQALQAFVRLHEGDETGSGLGLAIVARVAALLGARLSLSDTHPAPGLRATLHGLKPCA